VRKNALTPPAYGGYVWGVARLALIFVVACLAGPVLAAGPAQFLTAIPSVPLAPGCTEVPESAVLFDAPEGRIAQVILRSAGPDWAEIQAFYAHALPPLGWAPAGPNRWTRGGEVLRLEYVHRTGAEGVWVQIRLAPGA
jgi:hypothetical protein